MSKVSWGGSSDHNVNLGIHIIKDSETQAAKQNVLPSVFAAFQHKEISLLLGWGQVSDLDVAILQFVATTYTKTYWGQQGCKIRLLRSRNTNSCWGCQYKALSSVQAWDSSDFIPPLLEQWCMELPHFCLGYYIIYIIYSMQYKILHWNLPGY